MEDKLYAILMNKKILDEGIYYFSPITLIEGTKSVDEDIVIFNDNLLNEYLLITNPELIYSNDESGVWYLITEQELREKYPDCTLEDAKGDYFDDISLLSHFGFYNMNTNSIELILMNLRDCLSQINGFTSDINGTIMLNNKEETTDEKLKSKNQILSVFDDSYNAFIRMNSIKEMKVAIKQLEDFYIELSLKLDEMYDAKYSEKANDFLYELIDTYDSLLQYDDIEKIKEGIVKIQEKSRKNIVRIAESYKDESIYKIHEIEEEPEIEEEISKINVREMKKYFDQVIIGQEEAKKDVISAIVMNKLTEDKYNKNACLLVGPTGSGKTLIAESVSKYFDMPMEIIDTTQITMPGYVGANIEDFLVRLVTKTNGDIKKAEEGIVVFDELDKKGTENNSDVSGKGVLNTLLPFLQGTTYNLNYGGRTILFDTSKLTIFATGAFTDVAKAKKEDKGSNVYSNTNIGFNAKLDDSESLEDIKYEKLEVEDFVKYGNMPIELIGRFSTIAQLSGHTKESLRKILTESLTSPLLAEQSKLQKLNINLTWDDEYLDEVVNEALKLKTGARSLKNIVERTIKVARWEVLLNNDKYQEIHLIKDTIFDSYNCILVDNLGNNWVLRDRLSNEDDMKLVRKK